MFNLFRVSKKLVWIFLIVIGVILLLLYGLKLIEPSSPLQNVTFSNITDHQITVSWTTVKPTRATIYVSKDGKFPLLPFLSKDIYKDDGEKTLNRAHFYTTHKVTVGNLEPNRTYSFRIYQDWKRIYPGTLVTGSTLNSINLPNPVYGRVLKSDRKPAIGVLVYFQATSSATPSALLSALTNKEGRWSLDLGNLRSKSLKSLFRISSSSAEIVVVDDGKQRFKAQSEQGKDKPWPDIVLQGRE